MNDSENVPDPDAVDLAEDLRRAIGRFVRAVRKSAVTGISAQAETLALLDRGEATNISSLAQQRNVKHQTMRLVVAKMEASGLVRRDADPADGRSQLFSLTKAGRRVLMRGREARALTIGLMIRDLLSREEREALRTSIALFERMSASVKA